MWSRYQNSHQGIWYMNEIASRIVAKSGIPSDRFHLGKLILQSLKDAPDFVLQIDGANGELETNESILKRSLQCATAFKNLGLQKGDVISVLAPNNLHIAITMYAALYLGITFSGVDFTFGENELRGTFQVEKPKLVFCQAYKQECVKKAMIGLNFTCKILTFDKGDDGDFAEFLKKYGTGVSVNFKPTDFDPVDTVAFLLSTSGSTGLPKSTANTHKNCAITIPYFWYTFSKYPTPIKLSLVVSPIQWLSAVFQYLHSPILRFTRLQSSMSPTQEHIYYLINKYKPTFSVFSVNMLTLLLKEGVREKCDFTCYEDIYCGGSAFNPILFNVMKEVSPNTKLFHMYGLSEIFGFVTSFDPRRPLTVGKPLPHLQLRLVDVNTGKDIIEQNQPGELWCKGPSVMKEYYNQPEATASCIVEDGWLKTGDILYFDDEYYLNFVDKMKLLLKYKNYQVSPLEIENVIRKHPAVFEVVVTGVPHDAIGELPVAFIATHDNQTIKTEDITDMVRAQLSDAKQLRGGVIFLEKIPLTSTGKADRVKIKEMAKNMKQLFVNVV